MRRNKLIPLLLLSLLALSGPAAAWGPLGHRLVAALAWDALDPQARAEVTALLAGEAEPSLSGIANWADHLRENDPELGKRSASWHYVNIAENGCAYEAALACPGGDCVVEAIRRQTAIIADRSRPRAERLQALKFVVHFVGDVHQPLHAGYARDRGGNRVQVDLRDDRLLREGDAGRGSNLHSVWDGRLLASAGLDESAYLQHLREQGPVEAAGSGCPAQAADWAEASCRIALQPGVYPADARLDAAYTDAWRPVAETRLRAGGAHLAALLNRALGGS